MTQFTYGAALRCPRVALLAGLALAAAFSGVTTPVSAAEVQLTLVDDHVIGYATFQSHNQKVVQNQHGIFLTYVKTRNDSYSAQEWRVMRSRDGGRTFQLVHQATAATHPPVIETDPAGNLYLVHADLTGGQGKFYRFLAALDYQSPLVTTISNLCREDFKRGQKRASKGGQFRQPGLRARREVFHIGWADGRAR
jgi:hypothetical protein